MNPLCTRWNVSNLAGLIVALFALTAGAQPHNPGSVKGMEGFQGSTAAKELLARNGFVVSDPAFKQIFEAYIESPMIEKGSAKNPYGTSLPAFITTDSAWHTYHVLLEEGVKELEEIQAKRLARFSQQLLEAAKTQKPPPDELAIFASVGLALQDATHRQALRAEEKRIVTGLLAGRGTVEMPIGFPLAAEQFRAQSFYANSPALSDYFAARQWYASVVFRLSNTRETKLALTLATLINSAPELLASWKALSEPYDALLASAEDGTIREYTVAASAVLGTKNVAVSFSDQQISEIQRKLTSQLPGPRVNDQYLSPKQYENFATQTKGFRLLPPRQLPCAVCFHNTVDPKIPGRMYPSGLDFLAASPVLRSPAAVRAVSNQFGKQISELILKADNGPLPNSLHGEAMHLLAKLQDPLPAKVPAVMRSEAWSDLQLWTQLGAWAEQRHTWALHTKLSVMYAGMVSPPKGMVAPYPEFFSGLANLSRRTVEAFGNAGLNPPFEAKTAAIELLDLIAMQEKLGRTADFSAMESASAQLERLGRFKNKYYEKHQDELEKGGARDAYQKMEIELKALASRCSTNTASESDTESLRIFYDNHQSATRLLRDFVPLCERLAELARKSLDGEELTEEDAKWIQSYGVTLAGFHFYYGNSYEVPRDDFPIVTRVFSNPLRDSMLYAGLARPQALYIIVPAGKTMQLYRGAVMTYREFVRPNTQPLDDATWRQLTASGQTPPPPPFTRNFYAETSVTELIKTLRGQGNQEDFDFGDIRDTVWQIGSRATEKDLPLLIDTMAQIGDGSHVETDQVGEIIARLPWESRQKQFIDWLGSANHQLANTSARILLSRPTAVDAAALTAGFTKQPPRTRRIYCVLLARLPNPSQASRDVLLRALHEPADGVRWQSTHAIVQAGWNSSQNIAALQDNLSDTNEFVAAAAAYALGNLNATNAAPRLLEMLQKRLQSTNRIPLEDLEQQAQTISNDARGDENHAEPILEVRYPRLYVHRRPVRAQSASMRLPPMPFDFPADNDPLTDALMGALGDLKYEPATKDLFKLLDTESRTVALHALAKIAPVELATSLIQTALDKQADAYFREKALVALTTISATNHMRDLIPLLDDTTAIEYSRSLPGDQWRVCDRAAATIALLAGWPEGRLARLRPIRNDQTLNRAREWAKSPP